MSPVIRAEGVKTNNHRCPFGNMGDAGKLSEPIRKQWNLSMLNQTDTNSHCTSHGMCPVVMRDEVIFARETSHQKGLSPER